MHIVNLNAVWRFVTTCVTTFLTFIDNLPLKDLLVGVVVPILSAWISYALVERATRRKEYNRLFIQIELVKKRIIKK